MTWFERAQLAVVFGWTLGQVVSAWTRWFTERRMTRKWRDEVFAARRRKSMRRACPHRNTKMISSEDFGGGGYVFCEDCGEGKPAPTSTPGGGPPRSR